MSTVENYIRAMIAFLLLLLCSVAGNAQQVLEPVPGTLLEPVPGTLLEPVPGTLLEPVPGTLLEPVPVPITQAESDMILLINAPPDKNEAQLRSLFVDAINYKGSGLSANLNQIRAVRIAKSDYDDMKTMILGVAGKSSAPVTDGVVSQDSERSQFWKVQLPEPRPTGIRITYDKKTAGALAAESIEEDFPLGSMQDEDARFRYFNLKVAHLRLDAGWEPVSYQFLFDDQTGDKRKIGDKSSWPKVAKQFFAHIPSFRGSETDRNRFFEILRSGDIGEVLVNDSSSRPVRLIHMDVVGDAGDIKPLVLSRSFMLRVEPLSEIPYDFVKQEGIERVWVLMPLDRAQRDLVVEQLEGLTDPRVDVMQAIRDGFHLDPAYPMFRIGDVAHPIPLLPNLPKDWDQPTVLIDKIDRPMWFEVGLSGGDLDQPVQFRPLRYRRTFHLPVDAIADIVFANKYQVIVYETKARTKQDVPFSYRATLITNGNRDRFWSETQTTRWRQPQVPLAPVGD